jgi:hypothetical protein
VKIPAGRKTLVSVDLLVCVMAAVAATAAYTGGFAIRFSGVRLSVQTPARTIVALLILLAGRALFFKWTPPFELLRNDWRRLLVLPAGTEVFASKAAPGAMRRGAVAATGLALLIGILLHTQIANPYSVPDYGDPLFSIWRMGWVLHALGSSPSQLFNGNIFHPLPLALTLSDPIILPALLGAPLRAIGIHPVIVYNMLLFAGFWVSGVATYALVERLTGSALSAFVAGLVYASYSYRFDHYSHLELQMTFWMPLGLLALHFFVTSGRWRYALGLALAGAAQLYSGMYYSVFFLAYAVVVGVGLLIVNRPSIRALAIPAIGAAIVAGLLAVPVVRAFAAADPIKGERTVEEVEAYSATPYDYLRVNTWNVAWRDRLAPWVPEKSLFPGGAPLVLALTGLAPPLGPIRLVYGAALLFSIDGSFGLNGTVYPYLYRWLSPFRGMRSPARFGALVGLTVAIFSGFGARRIFKRCRSPLAERVAFACIVAAIVIDAWPALRLVTIWRDPPPIYETVRDRPGVVLAEFPVRSDAAFNAAFMYFSLWHWTPMINGYSGFLPAEYREAAPLLEEFPLGKSVVLLQRLGVTHVTVNCGLGWVGIEDCQTIMARVSRTPELRLIETKPWAGATVSLYELTRQPQQ